LQKVKELLNKYSANQKPFVFVKTYGCQQNVSDSERIKGIFISMGCILTNIKEKADVIVFNTCAIRENAEHRVFGNLGQLKNLKNRNPNLLIIVCGCMTEQEHIGEKIRSIFPFVEVIFGTNFIGNLKDFIFESLRKRSLNLKKSIAENYNNLKLRRDCLSEEIPRQRDNKITAFVPIMYGCDNFCTYCIVPYVRGREVSRSIESIKKEVENLVNLGYKEIILLGQNVNSYGKDLGSSFTEVLREVTKIDGDFWVRFMTSHPKNITKDMIDEIASNEKICKSLHLPFQSGCDKVLYDMNRKYTRKEYLAIIDYAKLKIPDILFTSDVIVGFPSEIYDDFKETLSLVKTVKFSSLFTFIYSKRKGTLAYNMKDNVSCEEKAKWFSELLKLQRSISASIYSSFVDRNLKVLVKESRNKKNFGFAKTNGDLVVNLENYKEEFKGKFCIAKIIGFKERVLRGIVTSF
jgi:tRNA-2-methylthio-N6-dimethylallyladenosine synthase